MISASTNFHTKVTDGETTQNLIISFDAGLVLSSADGDFTSAGVRIERTVGASEDYSFGNCPSSTLSFSAYNYNNRFANFSWGRCTVSVECDGETVPIGVFNVEKPAKVMTEIVNATDAYDDMKKFDTEITDGLRETTYPIGIQDFLYRVASLCGVTPVAYPYQGFMHMFPKGDYTITENPLGETGACTGRQMLKWICEFLIGNAYIDNNGKLALKPQTNSRRTVATFTDTDIASNGFEIAEFQTAVPDKLIVRNAAGLSYVDGSGDNIYTITANPWYQDLTMISLNDIANKLPVYHPATYKVIEADPCIECGDLVSFTLNGITNTMPIMSQTIVFTGRKTSAIYGSTGNAIRSNDETIENLDYSINVANNTGNIIKAIYAHGIDADYITTGKITDRDGKYSLDLETGEVHMASGEIGGWTFNGSQFYKDVADPEDPNVVYRTLLQGVRDGYLTGTYILACQKQVNGIYDTIFVLKSGGQMLLKGNNSAAMIDVVSDTNSKFHSAIYPSFIRVQGEAKDIATQEMIPDYTEMTHGGYNVWKNNNWRASLSASGLSFYDENFNTTAKYDAAPVVTTLSVTYPIQIVKCGNTVTFYGILTDVSSATTVYLGTVTRKPVAEWAVITAYSTSPPYNQIGTIWINNAGNVTLYKNSSTSMYVSGTYICQ